MEILVVIVEFLVAIGVGITAIRIYLQTNKLWKRKHEKVVAESISIISMLLSIIIFIPFTAKFILIDKSISLAVNYIILLVGFSIMLMISTGYWVKENRNVNFFKLFLMAIKLERGESGDLIKNLIHPKGAEIVLNILEKVAMVDKEVAKEEIQLINKFAVEWGLPTSKLTVGVVEEKNIFMDLRQATIDYLKTSPPKEQAYQLIDLITLTIKADNKITEEEEIILEELSGLVDNYVNKHEKFKKMFEVFLIPQNKTQKDTIEKLIPSANYEPRYGGIVCVINQFYSNKYAETIRQYYTNLGVFSVVQPT